MTTILVVDDETAIREVVEAILEDAGYAVVGATNGREGLAVLENEAVDLVISDVMMPVLDGLGLYLAMRQHPRYQNIPLVLTSATGPPRPTDTYHYAAFLPKPFDYDYLVTTIAQVLHGRR
jgi:CheY-like chemotaxis protein